MEIVFPVFLALAILRLSGALHVSWLWVTAPLWGNAVFVIALMGSVEAMRMLKRGRP